MSVTETRINLLDLDQVRMRAFFESIGEKPFRAQQILKWIYHQGVTDFDEMSNLSMELRQKLQGLAEIDPPRILKEQLSRDGTSKWLMGFGGGNAVETVFIPEPNRGTLCISSQVGCALNCTFCSTGAQGFSRNLSTAEIIGQVWLAARALGHERNGKRRITNVVLMGMGEPLLNFDAVVGALSLLRDDLGFGLAAKRVTLSTAGLVPGIDRLRETIDVALAVSLHAPEDSLRETLVPLNRKYPIRELMRSCAEYVSDKHKRSVTFEYTLIDGVNDHPEHARSLVKLLRRQPSKLNLIPFNPFPGTQYRCSPESRIRKFQEIVMASGLIATVRKTRARTSMLPAGNWWVKYWTARGEVKGSVSKCKGPEALRTLILLCLIFLAACSSTPDNSKEEARKAAETNASLGRSYMDRGQYEIALEKLKRAVAHDKTYAPAHTLLAILYETIGEDEQAEQEYKMAVKYDPEDGDVNNNYGAFLCAKGKSKEAERYFMTAIKDPFYSTPEVAYANAGSCALEQGDLDKAETFLRQSLEYNDQLGTALLPMAEVSYRKGSYLRARAFLQRYEAIAPMTEESLLMGFRIESEMGDQESASRYRTELLEQFPGSLKADGTTSQEQ